MNESPSFEQILDAQNFCMNVQMQHWLRYEVFSLQFWLLIAILVLPWFLWIKLVDKKRVVEILLYGSIVQTVVTVLDEIGCQLNLWEYRYDIEPLFPRLIPVNFTLLPISYMLIYQFFSDWKSYTIASVFLGAILAFIGEPMVITLDIYESLSWKHLYSFPIYIALAIIFKLVLHAVKKLQQSGKEVL